MSSRAKSVAVAVAVPESGDFAPFELAVPPPQPTRAVARATQHRLRTKLRGAFMIVRLSVGGTGYEPWGRCCEMKVSRSSGLPLNLSRIFIVFVSMTIEKGGDF